MNGNGGEGLKWREPEEDKRRGVVDRRVQGGEVRCESNKHGGCYWTREVEDRLKRRFRQ